MDIPVRILQELLLASGEKLPLYGADGVWAENGETAQAYARFVASHPPPKPNAIAAMAPTGGILDISAGFPIRAGKMSKPPRVMMWHHTGGHTGRDGLKLVMIQRGLSVNYFMDRGGQMCLTNPDRQICWHAGDFDKAPWKGKGLSNANALGCEVDALLETDVLALQVESAIAFAVELEKRFPGIWHLGHGETSLQKRPLEGVLIARAIRISDADPRIKPELLR